MHRELWLLMVCAVSSRVWAAAQVHCCTTKWGLPSDPRRMDFKFKRRKISMRRSRTQCKTINDASMAFLDRFFSVPLLLSIPFKVIRCLLAPLSPALLFQCPSPYVRTSISRCCLSIVVSFIFLTIIGSLAISRSCLHYFCDPCANLQYVELTGVECRWILKYSLQCWWVPSISFHQSQAAKF